MASTREPTPNKSYPPLLSVQEVPRHSQLSSIPSRYVQSDQDPPSYLNIHTNFPAVPTIDMTHFFSDDESTEISALQRLHSVCSEWGFFQLVNHGVGDSILTNLKSEIQMFFELPFEEKEKFSLRAGSEEGYGAVILSDDQKLDWGDRFYLIVNPIQSRNPNLMAQLPASFRTTLELYHLELQKLAKTIFGLLAKALGIGTKELEVFEDGLQALRMGYYPPCSQPELAVGLSPHSDATGITILYQLNGVNGLEVKKDGLWVPVNVLPDAFVVNVGDFLEMMTNGVYKSIEHRATVNTWNARMSIVLFVRPKSESEIEPLPKFISSENPPKFKKIKVEKYLQDFFFRKRQGKSQIYRMKVQVEEA